MKRTLITIVAAMFVAAGANAANITIDTDKQTYNPSETIIVTVTADAGAGETLAGLVAVGVELGWDDSVATGPANSSQTLWPGVVGSATTPCASSSICAVLNQTGPFPAGVNISGVVTGTLLLHATNQGNVNLVVTNSATNGGSLSVGTNFQNANVVPEPTTAALLGLGLVGLGFAGRRR